MISFMPADTPGRRLKVLSAGLHRLSAECEKITGELSADAASPVPAVSGWASSAATVNVAALMAGKDLTAIAERIGSRGMDYAKAGTMYIETDQDSGGDFRGLMA
jgi:hypothetical protein